MQISVSFASVYLLSASTDCDKDNCQSWRVKQASDGRNDLIRLNSGNVTTGTR